MNNQLQQLEDSVSRLAAQFNATVIENRQLVRQITLLKQQNQNQLADLKEKNEELTQKYERRLLMLQESMQHQIRELRAEKEHLQQVLTSSGEEIRHLLQLLPVSKQEGL